MPDSSQISRISNEKTGHTPGPWTYGDGHGALLIRRGVSPFTQICRISAIAVTAHERLAHANARLIAAAPELLEAAKEALDKLNVLLTLAGDEDPTWQKLYRAVEKAEGREK